MESYIFTLLVEEIGDILGMITHVQRELNISFKNMKKYTRIRYLRS